MKLFKWLNTNPPVLSDKVLMIMKAGKTHLLIDSIEKERKGLPQTNGITVKRVGV